jgi:N-acetylmuramoyl-L-alanine amidase
MKALTAMAPRALLALLVAALACLLSAAGVSAAFQRAAVTEIKHWSNPEYTRVVISLDRAAAFSHRLLEKDPSIKVPWRRLFIDIKGSVVGSALPKSMPIDDGLLKGARAAQNDRATVRVVLDIESIEDYKVFPLEDPYRIVVDVAGRKARTSRAPEAKPGEGAPTLSEELGLKVRRIVIDPGHGGKDPGAIGRRGLKEKDVTLRLAKMLKESLTSRLKADVRLTREGDVYVPLEERTAIANSLDADLFISLHVNASRRRDASGVETYILNLSQDDEARRVAARENSTSTRSVSDLEFILNDLIKTAKTNDSAELAASVQDGLVGRLKKDYSGVRSNGVKGAPFYVLVGTRMPSILLEVSFISNPGEEKRLRDESYLRRAADGISSGLIKYINGRLKEA